MVAGGMESMTNAPPYLLLKAPQRLSASATTAS
jgi:hypothetical protein